MKNTTSACSLLCLCFAIFAFAGCGKPIAVVDAGTYTGTIEKVVPAETEIYVSLDSGEQLELYFNEATELVEDGAAVDFAALSAGDPVEITVAREGNRNIPVRVELL